MKYLSVKINDIEFKAILYDTPTAEAIYKALPMQGHAQKWGNEIYFEIPVKMEEEPGAKEEVEIGDLAFWPVGSAFCIFFGKTPASINNKPRAYSPVNIIGKIEGQPDVLKNVQMGSLVQLKKFDKQG